MNQYDILLEEMKRINHFFLQEIKQLQHRIQQLENEKKDNY